jgi:hypothetical protein
MTDTTTTPTETQRARGGHDFYPAPGELPPLYATEDTDTADKTIRVHYVAGGCDWWLVEYDPAEGLAFGYACLGDPGCAEWGYVHLPELEAVRVRGGLVVVERDLGWTPRRVADLDLPGHPTR